MKLASEGLVGNIVKGLLKCDFPTTVCIHDELVHNMISEILYLNAVSKYVQANKLLKLIRAIASGNLVVMLGLHDGSTHAIAQENAKQDWIFTDKRDMLLVSMSSFNLGAGRESKLLTL